jgi:hypothetical protein
MNKGNHKPWRSTFTHLAATPKVALAYMSTFFEDQFKEMAEEDDEVPVLTLDNYTDYVPEEYYCLIEERTVDYGTE